MTSRAVESVWAYPRPPRVESDDRHVRVLSDDIVIADTRRSARVLETSHPPVFYIPPDDVDFDLLQPSRRRTFCEFKGEAIYWDLATGERLVSNAAWSYPRPTPQYDIIAGWLAFYPSLLECFVDDEKVGAQQGDFYGGWITSEVEGPFKGAPGTWGW
jgi:uncharacterized protein (DUF427 family)